MDFTKAVIKKQLEVDEEGYSTEVIDLHLKISIGAKDNYEEIRAALLQRVDRKFNQMFRAELGAMPQRLEEGERWYQTSLFGEDALPNVIRQGVDMLRRYGATIHAGGIHDDP